MPMKIGTEPFFNRVDKSLTDSFMREAMKGAQDRLRDRRLAATSEDHALNDWEVWRQAGADIRKHTLENLDAYLFQLSENYAARGGHVFFAETAEEAREYVQKVIKQKQAKRVMKSKSMVTEEISLNEALEDVGCEVLETDLAEYILQIDDHDPPSHIVAPALHKNKAQIRDTFREKRGYTGTENPEELTAFAREDLREKFFQADVGITGCNFAVADSGTIALVTNEGNANMVTTLPDTLITVMGMERLVPSMEDLDILLTLLCRSSIGQKLTTYVTMVSPELETEVVDSPKDYHLVIVDNGRSKAIGTEFQSALHCIRCAACVNVCPVYRHIGGHAYGSIYQGPIGAVLSPILGGYEEYGELPYASSLCAACTETCPVKIPLHDLLIKHRQNYVAGQGHPKVSEKLAMKAFGMGASSPSLFELATKMAPTVLGSYANGEEEYLTTGPGPIKFWTEGRHFPRPPKDNFRKWFDTHKKGAGDA